MNNVLNESSLSPQVNIPKVGEGKANEAVSKLIIFRRAAAAAIVAGIAGTVILDPSDYQDLAAKFKFNEAVLAQKAAEDVEREARRSGSDSVEILEPPEVIAGQYEAFRECISKLQNADDESAADLVLDLHNVYSEIFALKDSDTNELSQFIRFCVCREFADTVLNYGNWIREHGDLDGSIGVYDLGIGSLGDVNGTKHALKLEKAITLSVQAFDSEGDDDLEALEIALGDLRGEMIIGDMEEAKSLRKITDACRLLALRKKMDLELGNEKESNTYNELILELLRKHADKETKKMSEGLQYNGDVVASLNMVAPANMPQLEKAMSEHGNGNFSEAIDGYNGFNNFSKKPICGPLIQLANRQLAIQKGRVGGEELAQNN